MRKPRHKSDKEATYHVMSRTVQQIHFMVDAVKEDIIDPWLKIYSEVFYCTVKSEVDMTNHGHWLITMHKPAFDYHDLKRRWEHLQQFLSRPRKWHRGRARSFYKRITDLSCLMHDFKWRCAILFNRISETKGHFWDGTFKSVEVRGEHHEAVVDSYIQQNPVRAKMVEKPSDYPYGTTGRLKAALEQGEEVSAPAIGVFARIKNQISRAKAYIAYHDWMAYLIKNPQARLQLAPPEVIALAIPSESWESTCKEIRDRTPSNWSRRIYTHEAGECADSPTSNRSTKRYTRENPKKGPP